MLTPEAHDKQSAVIARQQIASLLGASERNKIFSYYPARGIYQDFPIKLRTPSFFSILNSIHVKQNTLCSPYKVRKFKHLQTEMKHLKIRSESTHY